MKKSNVEEIMKSPYCHPVNKLGKVKDEIEEAYFCTEYYKKPIKLYYDNETKKYCPLGNKKTSFELSEQERCIEKHGKDYYMRLDGSKLKVDGLLEVGGGVWGMFNKSFGIIAILHTESSDYIVEKVEIYSSTPPLSEERGHGSLRLTDGIRIMMSTKLKEGYEEVSEKDYFGICLKPELENECNSICENGEFCPHFELYKNREECELGYGN